MPACILTAFFIRFLSTVFSLAKLQGKLSKPRSKQEKWLFSTLNRDSCFITNDGVPCFIHNILLMNNNITFVCEKFLTVYESFMFPISSTKSGNCKVTRNSLSEFNFYLFQWFSKNVFVSLLKLIHQITLLYPC